MHPADWADQHHKLAPETTGKGGDWVTRPYQRGIFAAFCCDDIETVDVMKAARLGCTQILLAATAYDVQHRRRSGITYMPNDTDRDRFSNTHASYLLRDCVGLADAMVVHPDKRSKHNVTSRKDFNGATWHILGGFTPTNFREITADWVNYDELDGFVGDVGGEEKGEGSPTELGDTRMETSSYPKSRRVSTPTVQGSSRIESSLDNAEVLLWRYLPCEGCGDWFRLTWEQFKWESRDPDTLRHECPHCSNPITYPEYAGLDRQGRWRSEDGRWMDDEARFFDADGERIEAPVHVGMRIWSAYSYERPWSFIARLWWSANDAEKRGDKKPLKTFVNTKLGETWEEEGQTFDELVLMRNREQFATQVPDWVRVVVMSVDVQDDRLEFERVGFGPGEESAGLGYHKLYGDIGLRHIWDVLEREINTPLQGKDRQWLPTVVVIDSGGHYTSEVYEFCRRNSKKYYAIKGHKERHKPVIPNRLPKVDKGRRSPLMIGTDTAKELIYDRYALSEPGPGYCHYNADPAMNYDAEYFIGATAEKRVTRFHKGHGVFEWVKKPSVRNEPLDLRVYALAALRMLVNYWGFRMESKDKPQDEPEPETPPVHALRKSRNPALQRRPNRGGWVNGWRR